MAENEGKLITQEAVGQIARSVKDYVDGKLADKLDKNGTADKAICDKDGKDIATTYATKTDVTSGLNGCVKKSDNIGDAYITWGGKNLAGKVSAIDAAMVPAISANRFAFLSPSLIDVEYSRDGGDTWQDYEATDEQKTRLFNGQGTQFFIGKNDDPEVDHVPLQLRVTVKPTSVYAYLSKFLIYLSINGSTGCKCSVLAQTKANEDAGNDVWDEKATDVAVSGWSGWNVINLAAPFTTYSYGSNQYSRVRFLFRVSGKSSIYRGLNINRIFAVSGADYSITSSNMAKDGHLYGYDWEQNMILPKGLFPQTTNAQNIGHSSYKWNTVYANNFKGNADTATKAQQDGNGDNIVATYAKKSDLPNMSQYCRKDTENVLTQMLRFQGYQAGWARGIGLKSYTGNNLNFDVVGMLAAADNIYYAYLGGVYNNPIIAATKNRKVGINTVSPSEALEVNGNIKAADAILGGKGVLAELEGKAKLDDALYAYVKGRIMEDGELLAALARYVHDHPYVDIPEEVQAILGTDGVRRFDFYQDGGETHTVSAGEGETLHVALTSSSYDVSVEMSSDSYSATFSPSPENVEHGDYYCGDNAENFEFSNWDGNATLFYKITSDNE